MRPAASWDRRAWWGVHTWSHGCLSSSVTSSCSSARPRIYTVIQHRVFFSCRSRTCCCSSKLPQLLIDVKPLQMKLVNLLRFQDQPSKRSVQVTLWYRLNVWSWQILPPFHPIQLPDVVHREQNHFIHFSFFFDETEWNKWFQGISGATHLQVIQMIVQQHFSIGDTFLRPKKNKWHQALWERVRGLNWMTSPELDQSEPRWGKRCNV